MEVDTVYRVSQQNNNPREHDTSPAIRTRDCRSKRLAQTARNESPRWRHYGQVTKRAYVQAS